jgi:hypothetical protein
VINVIGHIEYLMLSRQCVIVPGLGAVLSQSISAHYDVESGAWLPPVRRFSFNPDLTDNDGILASSIARAQRVSYDAACRLLSEAVDAMRHQLEAERRLSLGRIGELSIDDEQRLTFQPYDAERLSRSAMWLPSVNVKTLAERRIEAEANDEDAIEYNRRNILARTMRRIKVAAVVIALIAVGVALTLPLRVENAQYATLGISKLSQQDKQSQESSLIERPGKTDKQSVLVLPTFDDAVTVVDTVEYNRQHDAYRKSLAQAKVNKAKPTAVTQYSVQQTTDVKPNKVQATTPDNNSGRYCLIVASLGSMAEAETYVAQHKDSNLSILAKDGHYRVYALTGESIADVQAKSKTTGVSARYPDAWVCRR